MSRLFASFFQGGFEGSTQRRVDGRQMDLVAAANHDRRAVEDYALLENAGIRTVRDSLRWHLIEQEPARYDWSSFLPMLDAAERQGLQMIWDLCHYGVPAHLDIWDKDFPSRFASFAAAAAEQVRRRTGRAGMFAPINEISFWAWAGGDQAYFNPHARDLGGPLKRQLVRAAIAAIKAIRDVAPGTRFIQPEPAIHVMAPPDRPDLASAAEGMRQAQFEAFDLLTGRREPELGGREDCLDIVGVNFYGQNQWYFESGPLLPDDPNYRPFHRILGEIHARYRRPMLIAETGAEGTEAIAWLRRVSREIREARRAGADIQGVCLYPVMDYPGWDNDRHCPCGLIEVAPDWQTRRLRPELAGLIAEEAACFGETDEAERVERTA